MRGDIRSAEDIGFAVRDIRLKHNLSQVELCERLGVSQRYLSELERGLPKILDDRYLGILRSLGIQLGYEVTE